MSRSAPSPLHSAKILCTHGNVTHGDFRGASGTVRTQPAALNALRAPRWGRVARQFLDEIFSLIQRNLHDEVLGDFSIKNLVINDLKRERPPPSLGGRGLRVDGIRQFRRALGAIGRRADGTGHPATGDT